MEDMIYEVINKVLRSMDSSLFDRYLEELKEIEKENHVQDVVVLVNKAEKIIKLMIKYVLITLLDNRQIVTFDEDKILREFIKPFSEMEIGDMQENLELKLLAKSFLKGEWG